MDIKGKRLIKGAQGNAATEYNTSHWFVRAGSWQYGAECDTSAIEAEKEEQDKRFGVPHDDKFKNPADSGFDADATLPNPHNFSNNPGFMSTSAGSAATSGAPAMSGGGSPEIRRGLPRTNTGIGGKSSWGGRTGSPITIKSGSTIGRSSSLGARNAVLPAASDTDPGSEGGPQIVSSGYSG
jgi:hypothetical protein